MLIYCVHAAKTAILNICLCVYTICTMMNVLKCIILELYYGMLPFGRIFFAILISRLLTLYFGTWAYKYLKHPILPHVKLEFYNISQYDRAYLAVTILYNCTIMWLCYGGMCFNRLLTNIRIRRTLARLLATFVKFLVCVLPTFAYAALKTTFCSKNIIDICVKLLDISPILRECVICILIYNIYLSRNYMSVDGDPKPRGPFHCRQPRRSSSIANAKPRINRRMLCPTLQSQSRVHFSKAHSLPRSINNTAIAQLDNKNNVTDHKNSIKTTRSCNSTVFQSGIITNTSVKTDGTYYDTNKGNKNGIFNLPLHSCLGTGTSCISASCINFTSSHCLVITNSDGSENSSTISKSNDSKDNPDSSSQSTTTKPTTGVVSQPLTNNNGEDDDEDDKKHPRKNREHLKLDLIHEDDNSKEEEDIANKDENPTSCTDNTNDSFTSALRNTPTGDSILMGDTYIRELRSCPLIPRAADPCVQYHNLVVSNYVSVGSSTSEENILHRDILVSKHFMPEAASDVLLKSVECDVSFKDNLCPRRQINIFGPKNNTMVSDFDVYYNDEFNEGPDLLECMNTVLNHHLIECDHVLNACLVERFAAGGFVANSSVFPDIIKNHICVDSPIAILHLGKQCPVDIIPKFTSLSSTNKLEAGRITLDHGSAVFLSRAVTKGYQLRSDFGFTTTPRCDATNATHSIRITFFRAKVDELPEIDELSESDQHLSPSPPKIALSHRISQESAYEEVINTCNIATLSKIIKLYDQQPLASQSESDTKSRVLDLLRAIDVPPPK